METEVEYFHFCHGFRFNFAIANYHQKKKSMIFKMSWNFIFRFLSCYGLDLVNIKRYKNEQQIGLISKYYSYKYASCALKRDPVKRRSISRDSK